MFEFVRRVSGAGWWVSQICYLTVEAGTEVHVTDRYIGSKKRQIECYVTVRSKIPLRNSSVNATKPAGDCTFTEEAINGKLCLLCSVTFTTYLVARSNQRISMYSIC